MTTSTREPLDSFELALLTELRTVVTEQAGAARTGSPQRSAPAPNPARRWTQRPAGRLLAGAAAAAVAAGAYLASPLGTSPAFAVATSAHGDVTVTVNRLEGAAALEKALADAGIRADVTYPGEGKQCQDGRYTEAPSAPDAGQRMGAHIDASTGGQSMTLAKGTVGSGQTLVIESSWPKANEWSLRVGIADGAVGPCVEVDHADPVIPGGSELPPGDDSGITQDGGTVTDSSAGTVD